jgi:hypothetical protein
VSAVVGPPAARYAFECSACGKCCNSPPAATFDELLIHEQRFIGCLSIRRAPAPPSGGAGASDAAGAGAVREWHALQQALPGSGAAPLLRIATRAYDYPSLGRCTALLADGRCAIHGDHQPGVCAAVPLDAAWPDALQPIVLHRRRVEASYFGANCIREAGEDSGDAPLLDAGAIVDLGYRDAVERLRRTWADEADDWGGRLVALFAPQLASTLQGRSISAGELTLSLVPVLALRSARSPADAARCRRYAQAQIELINEAIGLALTRRYAPDRPVTDELRRFSRQYGQFLKDSGSAVGSL